MIYVPRPAIEPNEVRDALCKRFTQDQKTELERARHYYSRKPSPRKAFGFLRYKEWAVCKALDDLFHEKCAYCESSYRAVDARNVEHFRPKGSFGANPVHQGYWWLAAVWSNLLPSCPACNQRRYHTVFEPGMAFQDLERACQKEPATLSGKGNLFPVVDNNWIHSEDDDLTIEDPLLIDPTTRDPTHHLDWVFDWDRKDELWKADRVLVAVRPQVNGSVDDPYGTASIGIYGLNRAGLLRHRMEHIRPMQIAFVPIANLLIDMSELVVAGKDISSQTERLREHKAGLHWFTEAARPYAGMSRTFIARMNIELEEFCRSRA